MAYRPLKGECIHNFHLLPSNYVVIDTETTGIYGDSEIIQLAALQIVEGVITDTFDTFVHSVDHIPPFITELTGITDAMITDAPLPCDALRRFFDFIGDQSIVAHNAHFDVNMLYDASEKYLGRPFTNSFFDTLYLSRHVLPSIEDHKLSTICNYFEIKQLIAHNALADCESLYQCLKELLKILPPEKEEYTVEYNTFYYRPHTCQTALGELRKTVNDFRNGVFSEKWLYLLLSTWLDDYIHVPDTPHFCDIYNKISSFVEDREIINDEIVELLTIIDRLYCPDNSIYNCCAGDIDTYNGKIVCFTGDLETLSRSEAETIVIGLGAIIKGSVTRKTNYLIVGSKGSAAWSNGNMGSKLKQALELTEKGIDIKILSEATFLESIGGFNDK